MTLHLTGLRCAKLWSRLWLGCHLEHGLGAAAEEQIVENLPTAERVQFVQQRENAWK